MSTSKIYSKKFMLPIHRNLITTKISKMIAIRLAKLSNQIFIVKIFIYIFQKKRMSKDFLNKNLLIIAV